MKSKRNRARRAVTSMKDTKQSEESYISNVSLEKHWRKELHGG